MKGWGKRMGKDGKNFFVALCGNCKSPNVFSLRTEFIKNEPDEKTEIAPGWTKIIIEDNRLDHFCNNCGCLIMF